MEVENVSDLQSRIEVVFEFRIQALREEISRYERTCRKIKTRNDKVVKYGKIGQFLVACSNCTLRDLRGNQAVVETKLSFVLIGKELIKKSTNLDCFLPYLNQEREIRLEEARDTNPYMPGKVWGVDTEQVNEIVSLIQELQSICFQTKIVQQSITPPI